MRAFEHLERQGLSSRTQIQTTIAGHNLSELADLVRLARDLGLSGIRFQAMMARGEHWRELWPKDAEAAVRALDGLLALQAAGAAILSPPSQLEAMKPYFRDPSAGLPELSCRSAATFAVDRKGAAYLCRVMEPVGDVRLSSPRDVWRGPLVGGRRAEVLSCHKPCVLLNCHFQASKGKC
jgi:MoaA/NifB/PqqE/SkfB family radical SAM enzyme